MEAEEEVISPDTERDQRVPPGQCESERWPVLPEARYVMVHAAGRFTTNLSLVDFFEPDVLLAVKHNGKEFSPEHGYPVRLMVPRLYFWKSAKWVTGLEFMKEDRRGFWESHGYNNHGDPWREERYG